MPSVNLRAIATTSVDLPQKVRASLNEIRFLDIHFDPATQSYSYAFIDLTLPYLGDISD